MKYFISLPNLVLSSQNAQLFCYAAVPFRIYSDICHELSLCVTLHFDYYIHGLDILRCSFQLCKYHKITQIHNRRLMAILKLFSPNS